MFELFRKREPKDPLEIPPEYSIDGKDVVFQEVITLKNGIVFPKSFQRTSEYFSDFKSFYIPPQYTIPPNIGSFCVDAHSNSIAFSYSSVFFESVRMGGRDESGHLKSTVLIQFKEDRLRYTMKIFELIYIIENPIQVLMRDPSSEITSPTNIFFSDEPKRLEKTLRNEAMFLRSLIYHSTERKDEDW